MPADPTGVTTGDHGPGGNGDATASPGGRPHGATSTDAPPSAAPSTDPASVPDPPVLGPPGRGAPVAGRAPAPGAPATEDDLPAASTAAPSAPPVGDGPDPTLGGAPAPVEAPPPVVPAPPRRPDLLGAAQRRVRGRHAARAGRPPKTDRASRRGLRIDQRLWSIDPWSVFKISALFYFCLGLIILVAGTLLYNAGRSVGTVDQFESFVTRMGAYGECTPTAEVPEGTEFEEDDKCAEGQVLVGGFTLDDGLLFRAAAISGTILIVAGSIGNVLLTVLLNLLNEVTGGLRHTIIREPVARPPGSGSARSPGGGDRRLRPGPGPGPAPDRGPEPGSPRRVAQR